MTATPPSSAVAMLHAELDRDPANQNIRRALADALADAGSKLSEGYAALAACGRVPLLNNSGKYVFGDFTATELSDEDMSELPADWWAAATDNDKRPYVTRTSLGEWVAWPSRRAAEQAIALAFLSLPDRRRAALLAGDLQGGL